MADIGPRKNADPNLLLGFDTSDDAAIYRITDDVAAVLTLDFFTPIIDDPYQYGAVAAANALSDVFAMGGKPVAALNILAFPVALGKKVVGEVLRGGADKVREAGAFVVGGHSIEDDEPKYGLSVFGTVHPDHIIRNEGAHPGDLLYYTKTLGTGIMTSALKAGLIDDAAMAPVIDSMMELNRIAGEAMLQCDVHAATDVTGFGLAGHLHEMTADYIGADLYCDMLPLFDDVYQLSADFCRPGKTFQVIEWAHDYLDRGNLDDEAYQAIEGIVCDPQSSGGLLVAIPAEQAEHFEGLVEAGLGRTPSLIGSFTEKHPGVIRLLKA